MKFTQLLYLESAMRIGSLRGAATDLGVAQPTLSEQIQRLEEELDLTLLIRSHHGVEPTAAAETLRPFILEALRAEQEILREARDLKNARSGTVRIGAVSLFTITTLPSVISEFRDRYPEINIEIRELGTGEIKEKLDSRDLELGLIIRNPANQHQHQRFRVIDIASGPLQICLHPDHPLAREQVVPMMALRGREMIAHHPGTCLREIFDQFRDEYELRTLYSTDTGQSAHRLIEKSGGMAFATGADIAQLGASGKIVFRPLSNPTTQIMLSVILREGERYTAATGIFLRALMEQHRDGIVPDGFRRV